MASPSRARPPTRVASWPASKSPVDGGATWQKATGTSDWSHTFSAAEGPITVQARAIDDSANPGTPASVSFTVSAQACPCSIFTPSTTGAQDNDNSAVELGVKFRADVDGAITGIRFYKTSGNTGAHTGTLWSTQGHQSRDGRPSPASRPPAGRKRALPTRFAIEADTTYVASYHTTSGHYATGTSFASAGVDNPPLHALQDGVDGPNGVYQYGPGGTYPITTFGSSNYLVDVVFTDQVGPDTTPPTDHRSHARAQRVRRGHRPRM